MTARMRCCAGAVLLAAVTAGCAGPARPVAVPAASQPPAASGGCVVDVHAWQRVAADGSHEAAVQLRPCPGPARATALEPYASLTFRDAAGAVRGVPVGHDDQDLTPEPLDTSVPVCLSCAGRPTRPATP